MNKQFRCLFLFIKTHKIATSSKLTHQLSSDNIVPMIKITHAILILFALTIFGCTDTHKTKKEASTKGIKLSDLQSRPLVEFQKTPVNASVRIYTFKIPNKNLDSFRSYVSKMGHGPIIFQSKSAFKNNNLLVGFSVFGDFQNSIKSALDSDGRLISNTEVLILDNDPFDIPLMTVTNPVYISYKDSTGSTKTPELKNGNLAWRILGINDPEIPGTIDLTLEPVFTKTSLFAKTNPELKVQNQDIVFRDLAMNLKFSPGEFIILLPDKTEEDSFDIAAYSFKRQFDDKNTYIYFIYCDRVS